MFTIILFKNKLFKLLRRHQDISVRNSDTCLSIYIIRLILTGKFDMYTVFVLYQFLIYFRIYLRPDMITNCRADIGKRFFIYCLSNNCSVVSNSKIKITEPCLLSIAQTDTTASFISAVVFLNSSISVSEVTIIYIPSQA